MKLNAGKVKIGPEDNILTLDVPPQLESTVSTGVPFLDDAFGGTGITPSMVTLFSGTPGAGKTTLMLQMADAMTGKGSIALFNTNEENLYQVRKVTKRLGLKHGFIPGQNRMVKDVLDHCRLLQEKNPGKQVILIQDSLQSCDDGKYSNGTNNMSAVRCMEMFTEWAKETYGIVFVIGQCGKNNQFLGRNEVKHIADAHAHVFIDDGRSSETYGERVFRVEKNRFGCNGISYLMEMTARGMKEKVKA